MSARWTPSAQRLAAPIVVGSALLVILLGVPRDIHAQSGSAVDVRGWSARIDARIGEQLQREQVRPAELSDDSEFLRRAWLDLCGTIPPLHHPDGLSGVLDFLESKREDKREAVLDSLLASPAHARRLAEHWGRILLPPDSGQARLPFELWLRQQFVVNVPYDELARRILLARGSAGQAGPSVYYTSLQLKPEELAASTSQVFLGTQIHCAQCHNHPFDHWRREDFWGFAAFFARLKTSPNGQPVFDVEDVAEGEVMIPGLAGQVLADSERPASVAPRFLNGAVSGDDLPGTRRERLAEWLVSAENPYFARAAVNRVWGLMLGRGLVTPVDDLGDHNPPLHPELLDELAREFVASGHDLRLLIRAIAGTQAYQRTSRSSPGDPDRPELFARMAVKPLSGEQLYGCLSEAMRRRRPAGPYENFGAFDPLLANFLSRFGVSGQDATRYEAGIPQALTMINGGLVRQATDLVQSDLLVALDAPFLDDEQRIGILFLTSLGRQPTDDERAWCRGQLERSGEARRRACADILWALLNSGEFALNH